MEKQNKKAVKVPLCAMVEPHVKEYFERKSYKQERSVSSLINMALKMVLKMEKHLEEKNQV